MPDNAFYWWGYMTNDIETNAVTHLTWTQVAPTFSTYYIQTSTSVNYSDSVINTTNKVTGTLKWVAKVVSNDYWYGSTDSKTLPANWYTANITNTALATQSLSISNQYGLLGESRGGTYAGACTAQFYAIWLE